MSRQALLAWFLVLTAFVTILIGVAEIPPIIDADHLPSNHWMQIYQVLARTTFFKYAAGVVSATTLSLIGAGIVSGITAVFHFFAERPHNIIDVLWMLALAAGFLSIISAIFANMHDLSAVPRSTMAQLGAAIVAACMSFGLGGAIARGKGDKELQELRDRFNASQTKVIGLHLFISRNCPSAELPPELLP